MSKITITLKSDLCVGSGQGYASYVDIDVCFDKNGVPFIPARRLKGLLRDAAEYIGVDKDEIKLIFGKIADKNPGALTICNACLDINLPQIEPPHLVLNKYTRVLSNTRLENGIADTGSLRTFRVVNRYTPDKQEQKFIANCYIECTPEEKKDLENLLKRICKAVRNIGMKRSRGLGAVRFEFDPAGSQPHENVVDDANTRTPDHTFANADTLEYTITAKAPLMLPNQRNEESETFISGTLVQGAILSKLPKKGFDEAVREWFLGTEAVCVSNAYIEGGVPAPSFIVKLKPSGILTTSFSELSDEHKDEQKKKLKGEYIVFSDVANTVKAKTETRYHHRYETKNMKEELYSQTSVSEGQRFVGKISGGNADKLSKIAQLLDGDIWIGRSKTAEYGRCEIKITKNGLEAGKEKANKSENGLSVGEKAQNGVFSETIELSTAESVFYVFESDALLVNGAGIYSTRLEDIISEFNLDNNYKYADASLDVTIRGGYSGVWNLKKPSVPCVKAGSYIEFTYNGDEASIQRCFSVGERVSEGFGHVKLYKKTEIFFDAQKDESVEIEYVSAEEEFRQDIIQFAKKNYKVALKLTPSFIGRILLMISRAENYSNFHNMLNSVKDEKKKVTVQDLIADCGKITEDNYKEMLKLIFTLFKYKNREG